MHASQMIAAERVEQEPFFTDYANYNEADKGIRDINRDLSLSRFARYRKQRRY